MEISGLGLSSVKAIPLSGLDDGVYYFIPSGVGGDFQKIETILPSTWATMTSGCTRFIKK